MKKILLIITVCAVGFAAVAQVGVITNPFRWNTNAPFRMGFDSDPDTQSFISRAGITRNSEKVALGFLVQDLKRYGIWTNLVAFYPFVGSSAASCAANLVSNSLPITWNGTNTFSPLGVTGDGISGWGDTGYKQSSRGALTNNFHIYAYYASPANASGPIAGNWESDAWGGVGSSPGFWGATQLSYIAGGGGVSGQDGQAIATEGVGSVPMLIGLTTDGILRTNFTAITPGAAPTNSVRVLGNVSQSGTPGLLAGYSDVTLRAVSFGNGLSFAQSTNLFNAVSAFETRLNRQ